MPPDAATRIQSIVKLCADGLAENAADQGQHAVGGYGVRFRDLVEDGLDFADADLGQAALCEVDAVLPVGQVLGELCQVLLVRLLVRLAVLLVEQREHLAEGDFRALLALLVGWVAAQSHLAVMFDGLGARFVHREVSGAADLDALRAAIDLLVQNVGLDAAGADADSQAGHFCVVVILPAGLRDRKVFDARLGEVDAVGRACHGGQNRHGKRPSDGLLVATVLLLRKRIATPLLPSESISCDG